jgi:VIT1/CCC1 family predicted Fe2+/Mn2+ transporter/rubrerythrin
VENTARRDENLAALRRNWLVEMTGAATYRELAAAETDERRRAILVKMAEAEERHAARFAERIAALGGRVPTASVGGERGVLLAAKVGGLDAALKRLEDTENRQASTYAAQASTLDPESASLLADIEREESDHAITLRALTRPSGEPRSRLDAILKRERWHSSSGSWIGDAIYGVNDGLTAVFGIVSGVAAAAASNEAVVVAGVAGLLSSALSMGASAYLANKSEREVFEAELAREKRELETHPEEEKEELELFYQLKGFTEDEARALAERIAQRPDQFLKTLAREELGLSEENLPNPVLSAGIGTLSTALGALVPVAPFLFMSGSPALIASFVVSIVGHFAVGSAKSLVTARSWWKSGLEMTVVAVLVAGLAYFVGGLFKLPG